VVALRAPKGATGREQRGSHPAIVLQSDDAVWLSTTIVAPTSTSAQPTTFRPEVRLKGGRTLVLLDQLRVVDRSRLSRSTGRLDAADLRAVERSLRLILDLF
jgi:mRNA interferase MazF